MYEAQDGGHLFAGAFNSITDAWRSTGVISGCEPTVPSSDTVDVASGEILVDGNSVDVSAQSVTISATSDGVRYTTLALDDTGSVVSYDGNVDTSDSPRPAAPNVAELEVYLAFVRVGTSGIEELYDGRANPKIYAHSIRGGGKGSGLDADVLRGSTPGDLRAPFFGTSDSGDVVRSSNTTESGVILADSYTLESGVTATVDGYVMIIATDEIVINGTLDGHGNGAAGGAGSTDKDVAGEAGNDGSWRPLGRGGSGGSEAYSGGAGGPGGDGDLNSTPRQDTIQHGLTAQDWLDQYDSIPLAGAGGGGGGASSGDVPSDYSADNGNYPGGGGGAEQTDEFNDGQNGGDGGNGGAGVLLCAPTISGSGTIDVSGQDGQDGGSGGAGAGGGGGGSGGACALIAEVHNDSFTVDTSRGLGGAGGSGSDGTGGGDGADGAAGTLERVYL